MTEKQNTYKIASYNIENMGKWFTKDNKFKEQENEQREAVVKIIMDLQPHILGIIEASRNSADHEFFLENTSLKRMKFNIAKSENDRGKQDLAFYYREPFDIVSIDDNISFYDDWNEDIDADGITEELNFERKPLEVIFRNKETGDKFLIILVSFKSKGVFSAVDLYKYEHLALANRKKLYAQSKKVRQRIENLMNEAPELPFMVMGDINDEIGLDHFQKIIGTSAVETIMGDIFHPDKILHNALWHLIEKKGKNKVWTVQYPDPIISGISHKSLIDHIFISPQMLSPTGRISYVKESGNILNYQSNPGTKIASDHLPVYCKIRFNT